MHFQPPIHVGDLVEIRRSRWRIADIRPFEDCELITACGINASNAGVERLFLLPFESIIPVHRQHRLRLVGPRRWRHACRGVLADYTPPDGLRTAARAHIDLMPHQLEPALAVARGSGSRLLLADEVGLGKTIQAGLIISELRVRAQADRVLVITPSGLRDQWRDELDARFGISAVVLDDGEVRRRAAGLRIGLNPWTTVSNAIVSIDYVKRPEVLQAAADCAWDIVVIDEAHAAGRESDRLAAVSRIARRTAYVVLVTATPHSGDARNFAALCRIGALGDPLLVFRRTRHEVQPGARRRVHVLRVTTSAAERRMWTLLGEYAAAVRAEHADRDAWLALSVLYKRAFSSARSLALTVGRRLASLDEPVDPGRGQLLLPLDDRSGEFDDADSPPDCLGSLRLGDPRLERRLLRALHEAADRAARGETKAAVLQRLLRRVKEPALVFTEFRDTLLHLAAVLRRKVVLLHGGLTRDERRRALEEFLGHEDRVLLATDAAGEGLNLHRHCRLVVNLELPWNPVRLEQRIGRVDRIGQRRTVHAIHLVAAGTRELDVLDRLKARVARARREMSVANPIEDDERAIAGSVMSAGSDAARSAAIGSAPIAPDERSEPDAGSPAWQSCRLANEALVEVSRLSFVRRLSSEAAAAVLADLDANGPWITRARRRSSRARLGRRAIALVRVDREDGTSPLFDWVLVPLSIALTERLDLDRSRLIALSSGFEQALRSIERTAGDGSCAPSFAPSFAPSSAPSCGNLAAVRLDREQRIAEDMRGAGLPTSGRQPGLFDHRAERERLAESRSAAELAQHVAVRMRLLERSAAGAPIRARLLLVLVP
jgi:superfamily II DNA or RNA helicase